MRQLFKTVICILPLFCLASCFKRSVDPVIKKPDLVYDLSKALLEENVAPVVIIGSGPAGLSAALYIARAGMKSFVFAGPMPCGQLTETTYVENWPGREHVLGLDLMQDIKKQAESFGTTIIYDNVIETDFSSWPFTIKTSEGKSFKALAVIVATGATPRKLNIPGESEYWGKGVTTCAVCDAYFFKGKEVVISGGGDSAAEMVFELAPYAKKVTMLVRKGSMRAAVAMQQKVAAIPNASVEYHKEIKEIYGDGEAVTGIELYDNEKKTSEKRRMDGVFLAIGHDPNNKMFKDQLSLDDHGYVVMNGRSQQTSIKGVFAAGEIQDPSYRQGIVASGEGAKAALDASAFLYDIGFSVEVGVKLEQNFFEHFSDVKKEIKEITSVDELYREVINVKGVVAVDAYALDCPCCMRMLPYLESVASKLDGKVKVIKVNTTVSRQTVVRELQYEHGVTIRSLPSLIVFKDGKLKDINKKVMNKAEIYSYLQKFLDN